MGERREVEEGGVSAGAAAACVFVSGVCALVYQTVWLREFGLVFGGSTAASAAVLATFMGGIGVGSALLGRGADRSANPLARYGRLELAIALTASATPLAFPLARLAYVALGGSPALGTGLATVVRFALAALVIAAPTVLMGGTLAAAVRAAERDGDARRSRAALLYGVNALGGVAGALLSTFVLIEALGNRGTLFAACVANAMVALAALRVARCAGETSSPAASDAPPAALRAPPAAPRAFVLAAAAATGFAYFLLELVWHRMLAPLLGGSTFTFGLILGLALLGIAVGSFAFAAVRRGRPVTPAGFAAVCALEAACVALPLALGDRLVTLTVALQPFGSMGFAERVAQWGVVAGIIVLPASILAGAQFPMLIALLGRGREGAGADTGHASGWNTAGAVAGSIAGGFGLLPALGAVGAWRLAALLLVVTALAALVVHALRHGPSLRLLPAALGAAAALALVGATGPTAAWRHSPVGAGRAQMDVASANSVRQYVNARSHFTRWESEGVESSVALMDESGYAFIVNGKVDGNARADAATQVMLGLLGALVHPEPKDALVVGLGTGSSAGWLADVPSIERVDVVELEPSVRRVAEDCAPVNRDALANPKLHLWFGDAREAVLVGRRLYDVIASEPSNPYRAGVAGLFTREFHEAAAARLRPQGLFVQWVQAYEVDGETIRNVCATLTSVFASVETWQSESGDLVFVASREPVVHDVAKLRARIAEEPYRSALAYAWRVTDLEGVFGRYVGNPGLAAAVARGAAAVNTDDRNLLEFAFARTVGVSGAFDVRRLAALSGERGLDRPATRSGALDFAKVADRRISAFVLNEPGEFESADGDDAFRARTAAKVAYAKLEFAAARDAWFRQSAEPGDLVELLAVAHSLAATRDDRTAAYASRLARWLPHEAEAVMAQYAWLAERPDEARAFAERALAGFRTDPWPRPTVMAFALEVATQWHGRPTAPRAAVEEFAAGLATPFAVGLLETERTVTRFNLTRRLDAAHGTRHAVEALAAFEPHVPWTLEFLGARAEVYEKAGHPLAAAARADLERFRADAPPVFDLGPSAPPTAAAPSRDAVAAKAR